jgi:hypothetical protein
METHLPVFGLHPTTFEPVSIRWNALDRGPFVPPYMEARDIADFYAHAAVLERYNASARPHRISSRLLPSHPIPAHPISSHLILSHPVSSHLLPSPPISSHLLPSPPISSHPIACVDAPRGRVLLELEYPLRLEEGDALLVDNTRVLHGRFGFVGRRNMIGCYMNADDWRSKLRVLEVRAASEPQEGAAAAC